VAAAHCQHFLALAETVAPHLTGPDQGRWLTRLVTEQSNLRRAAGHAARDPDGTERLLRFGVAMRRYWITRAREDEAFALLRPALDRPDARADLELFTAALITTLTSPPPSSLVTRRSRWPASSPPASCSSTRSPP